MRYGMKIRKKEDRRIKKNKIASHVVLMNSRSNYFDVCDFLDTCVCVMIKFNTFFTITYTRELN